MSDDRDRALEWLIEHKDEIEETVVTRKRRIWLMNLAKNTAIWIAAVGAGIATIRTLGADFFGGPRQ